MRKNILRNLVILNCILMTVPNLAFAEESTQEPTDVAAVDEVVVTAVPLDKYLVTTSVITDKDIEEKGAKNLSQALDDVPGVHMHRGRKGNNTIDIRGSSISYTKIYIDGVLVNPLATVGGDVDLDMFPVDNIAKIEVIKGPAPVSYGTDAIGGIILITTKNGKTFDGGKVSMSAGSDSTRNLSVCYGDGNDKFNYFLNAGTKHTDGYTENSESKSNYINAKLKWKLKDSATLTLQGGYSLTDKSALNRTDPATGHIISSTTGWWPGLNNWEYRDWKKTDLSLTYTEKVNNSFDYTARFYRFTESQGIWADGRLYDSDHVTVNGSGIATSIDGNSIKAANRYSTTRWNASYWDSTLEGMDVQGNLKLNPMNTLTFGTVRNKTEWKQSDSSSYYDPYDVTWEEYENKRNSLYVQDNYTPNDKTTITIGLRRDKNEVYSSPYSSGKSESAVNPSVNFVYLLDDDNTLRASFGKTISFPTVNQLYGKKGNPSLKPERAENYELGLKHRFDDRSSGDIAFFKNFVDDLIDTDIVGGSSVYVNVNELIINGVEMELNRRFSDRCEGFFNYTYLDTTASQTDGSKQAQKNTPRHDLNYGVTYHADKGYKFSLTGHVVGERATWDDGTGDTRPVSGARPTLGSVHTMDFQVKREINDRQDWYINVFNIFDKDYEDELFYQAAGRTVIAGLDFKF